MIRIITALFGLFLMFGASAQAQEDTFRIPQEVIQQAINERLPLTARNGKWFEFVFLQGNTVTFNADGTISLHGKVQAMFDNKVYYTGIFDGTTNLRYDRTEEAFFLSRPSLNNIKGELTPNTERTGIAAAGTQWMLKGLNNLISSKGFAPVFAAFAQQLEKKPVFKLNPDNPVHRSIATALGQPDVQILVREKALVVCKGNACNNL